MANDPRERRREGSRRAQAARQRKAEAQTRRKNRNIVYGVILLIVVIAVVVTVVLLEVGATAYGHAAGALPFYQPPDAGSLSRQWFSSAVALGAAGPTYL